MTESIQPYGHEKCLDCGIGKQRKNNRSFVRWRGDENSPVVIVGQAPGETEEEKGCTFVGPSGELLEKLLQQTGLAQYTPLLANVCQCVPHNNRSISSGEVKTCASKYLLRHLQGRQLIISVGGPALKGVTGKPLKISKVRGLPVDIGEYIYGEPGKPLTLLPTVHPAAAMYAPDHYTQIKHDLELAARMMAGEKIGHSPSVDCRVFGDAGLFGEVVDYWEKNHAIVAWDIESTGLDPYTEQLRGMSLSDGDKAYWINLTGDVHGWVPHLTRLLQSPNIKTLAFNAKFDMRWVFVKLGIDVTNLFADVQCEAVLVDENLVSTMPSLVRACWDFLEIEDWETELKAEVKKVGYAGVAEELLIPYACCDSAYTWQLHQHLRQRIEQEGSDWVSDNLLTPVLREFTRAETRGVQLDLDAVAKVGTWLEKINNDARAELAVMADMENFNPGSPKQISVLLYSRWQLPTLKKTKGGSPSTDEETLKQLLECAEGGGFATIPVTDAHVAKFISALIRFRSTGKQNSTYVTGLEKQSTEDGTVRASFNITGARTGRTSCTRPALQTIPKPFRPMFCARPGNKFVFADYGQMEVRVWAAMSKCPHLTEALQNVDVATQEYRKQMVIYNQLWADWYGAVAAGGKAFFYTEDDLLAGSPPLPAELRDELIAAYGMPPVQPIKPADAHIRTASLVFRCDVSQVTPQMRQHAKAYTFGLMYGMSVHTMAGEYGMTEDEAKAVYKQFFSAFPVATAWIEERMKKPPSITKTLFGRVRHFPSATVRQCVREVGKLAVNSPIQGGASDIALLGLLRANRALDSAGIDGRALIFVHDEIVFEIPDDAVDTAVDIITQSMTQEIPSMGAVPLSIDLEVGDRWAGNLSFANIAEFVKEVEL